MYLDPQHGVWWLAGQLIIRTTRVACLKLLSYRAYALFLVACQRCFQPKLQPLAPSNFPFQSKLSLTWLCPTISIRIMHSRRLVDRRYLVLCAAPTSLARCPSPFWISTRAKPPKGSPTPPGWPEGLNTTTANGVTTIEFNVAARCACSSAFFGVVESAQYRNLPAAACGR